MLINPQSCLSINFDNFSSPIAIRNSLKFSGYKSIKSTFPTGNDVPSCKATP